MAKDYSKEPPITKADRLRESARAARFKYSTQYALTVCCDSEPDQQRLFKRLAKLLPTRRIRVVVS